MWQFLVPLFNLTLVTLAFSSCTQTETNTETNIVYIHCNILTQPKINYTGVPVLPVTLSISVQCLSTGTDLMAACNEWKYFHSKLNNSIVCYPHRSHCTQEYIWIVDRFTAHIVGPNLFITYCTSLFWTRSKRLYFLFLLLLK